MEIDKVKVGIEERFYPLCVQAAESVGLELYDMEYISGSSTLRVFVVDPKTNSAVIEDCVAVDRALSPYFEEDWIPDDIVLEVSSPGVYRNLKTPKHFEKVVGDFVLIQLVQALTEKVDPALPKKLLNSKKIRAKLVNVVNDKIKLDVDGYELEFAFDQIKKASLDPEV
jgi:ribosome maturation factor RimP